MQLLACFGDPADITQKYEQELNQANILQSSQAQDQSQLAGSALAQNNPATEERAPPKGARPSHNQSPAREGQAGFAKNGGGQQRGAGARQPQELNPQKRQQPQELDPQRQEQQRQEQPPAHQKSQQSRDKPKKLKKQVQISKIELVRLALMKGPVANPKILKEIELIKHNYKEKLEKNQLKQQQQQEQLSKQKRILRKQLEKRSIEQGVATKNQHDVAGQLVFEFGLR